MAVRNRTAPDLRYSLVVLLWLYCVVVVEVAMILLGVYPIICYVLSARYTKVPVNEVNCCRVTCQNVTYIYHVLYCTGICFFGNAHTPDMS